jgi:tetratricopeptide (TPR) repeat protein
MKKYFLSLALALAVAGTSLAQRTPQASPSASVMQTVGITDFTVSYSRPGVKGRTIFGDSTTKAIVRNGELWRTGANMATTLEATTDFMFGGKQVPAGKYALFSIPGTGEWTVILNKNWNQGGTADYKQSEDVARYTAYPTSTGFNESFLVTFTNVTDKAAQLNLSWSTVNVSVPLEVKTTQLTLSGLDKAVAAKPEDVNTLMTAAGYILSTGSELDKALALTDKAIGLQQNFRNVWLKAQILDRMNKTAEALPLAQKALAMGKASNDGAMSYMGPQIEAGIKAMQAKVPAATAAATPAPKKKK